MGPGPRLRKVGDACSPGTMSTGTSLRGKSGRYQNSATCISRRSSTIAASVGPPAGAAEVTDPSGRECPAPDDEPPCGWLEEEIFREYAQIREAAFADPLTPHSNEEFEKVDRVSQGVRASPEQPSSSSMLPGPCPRASPSRFSDRLPNLNHQIPTPEQTSNRIVRR